jgi:3',5'-cyclic AMP phosphodiesterase CpdA
MVRIVQISDTHLSPTKRHFHDNWEPLRVWTAAQNPDLVIHTGDVTVDGADMEEDMAFCAGLLRDIGVEVLAVPGNHDVGEPGNPRQPVNEERIARWRRHFGPDYWHRDVGFWRIVGLNSMLFGSGEPAEKAQFDWLSETMRGAGGRHIAWFTHRPLFLSDPFEGVGYWAVPPAERAALLKLVRDHRVRLVSSGHLHRAHKDIREEVHYIWAPSSGFVVGPSLQPEMPGEARLGAALVDLDDDGLSVTIEDVPNLRTFRIEDVIDEVYPRAA